MAFAVLGPEDLLHPLRAPFVPWKCPVCPADILSNRCGVTHPKDPDLLETVRIVN